MHADNCNEHKKCVKTKDARAFAKMMEAIRGGSASVTRVKFRSVWWC